MKSTMLEIFGVGCLAVPLLALSWPLAFIPFGLYFLVAGIQLGGDQE